MKRTILLLLLTIGAAAAAVNAQDRCFKNEGLKALQTVSLTITGAKVAGTFVVSGYDGSGADRTYEFSGTKSGSRLTVKFKGKPPYELAPGTKTIVWTLAAGRLKIPIYGKNYETGKYSTYSAVFEPCGEI